MRSPNANKLTEAFRDLTREKALLIKKIAAAVDNPDDLEKIVNKDCAETAAYVRSMHSSPYRSQMWRITVALHAIGTLVEGHGVEGLGPPNPRNGYAPPYEYVNMGDTYAATLIYKRDTDTLSIGCWGDIVERHPNWE